MIFIENLNFSSLLNFIKISFRKKSFSKCVYYIYEGRGIKFHIIKYLFYMIKVDLKLLDFKMMNIREKNQEITRLYIPRVVFFSLNKILLKCLKTKKIDNKISFFLSKEFFTATHFEKYHAFRTIFIISVINNLFDKSKNVFITSPRPFYSIYKIYADKFNIELVQNNQIPLNIKNVSTLLLKNLLFFFNDILKYIKFLFKSKIQYTNIIKIYCEGNYQPNLKPNGFKSDFFWLINSEINYNNILYNSISEEQRKELKKNNINTSLHFENKIIFSQIINHLKFNPFKFNIEDIHIESLKKKYERSYLSWFNYFKLNNVKVSLNWHKYNADHIPIINSLNDLNGISCFYQMNFEGTESFEYKTKADINFCMSKETININKKIESNFAYEIITGYPNYKVEYNIYEKAKSIREKFFAEGVEKIISVFDENSTDDSRWHTGHELQIENYEFILLELLKNKKLGVIFKPKHFATLYKRLGKLKDLIDECKLTNRCLIYSETNNDNIQTTKALPILAGLSSDLVIHSHLCAGTAAIETALHKIPTILIDREQSRDSLFYKVLNKNLIYNNWNETIDAINFNLFSKNQNSLFGQWGEAIEYFDPFRDEYGGQRIGSFLNDLIDGYNMNYKKEHIIEKALTNYIKKWGKDKVSVN